MTQLRSLQRIVDAHEAIVERVCAGDRRCGRRDGDAFRLSVASISNVEQTAQVAPKSTAGVVT